jgi:hypothetical protein
MSKESKHRHSLFLIENVPFVEPAFSHLLYRYVRNYRRIVAGTDLRDEIILKGHVFGFADGSG